MEYKSALGYVRVFAPLEEFSARGFSDYLIASLKVRPYIGDYQMFATTFSIKRVSGDLDRLYRMGFLSRRRVKRILNLRNSPPVNRGFSYLYKISKQGRQYLDYLSKPKTEDLPDPLDMLREAMAKDMHRRLPEQFAEMLEEYMLKSPPRDRGRYKRFPVKKREPSAQ